VELRDECDEENDCTEEIRKQAGKAKTVEAMERSSTGNREAGTLYLTDLTIRKGGAGNSDLLRFYAKVETSHSKTRSAHTLMDPGALHFVISILNKQSNLAYLFNVLAECPW
jgi:hypothetical protein